MKSNLSSTLFVRRGGNSVLHGDVSPSPSSSNLLASTSFDSSVDDRQQTFLHRIENEIFEPRHPIDGATSTKKNATTLFQRLGRRIRQSFVRRSSTSERERTTDQRSSSPSTIGFTANWKEFQRKEKKSPRPS